MYSSYDVSTETTYTKYLSVVHKLHLGTMLCLVHLRGRKVFIINHLDLKRGSIGPKSHQSRNFVTAPVGLPCTNSEYWNDPIEDHGFYFLYWRPFNPFLKLFTMMSSYQEMDLTKEVGDGGWGANRFTSVKTKSVDLMMNVTTHLRSLR